MSSVDVKRNDLGTGKIKIGSKVFKITIDKYDINLWSGKRSTITLEGKIISVELKRGKNGK